MVQTDDDPDLKRMIEAGVGLDDDGDFDPTNLLSQPLNFDDDIDELGINIEEDRGDNSYVDSSGNHDDDDAPDGDKNTDRYYDGRKRNRKGFIHTTSPDYQPPMNHRRRQGSYDHVDDNSDSDQQRQSAREYEPPPFKPFGSKVSPDRHRIREATLQPREKPRNKERLSQVQLKIRQVQQQIHENMDVGEHHRRERRGSRDQVRQRIRDVQKQIHENFSDDDHSQGREMRGNHRHSYHQGPSYSELRHHRDQDRRYSDNYPEDSYRNGDPTDRYPHKDHSRSRSYNGMPGNIRGEEDYYGGEGHHRSRSYPPPPPPPSTYRDRPHYDTRDNENHYGPQDRGNPMHPMRRGQSPYGGPPPQEGAHAMPVHHRNQSPGRYYNGIPSHGHNHHGNDKAGNSMMHQQRPSRPQHMLMNESNNGNMPRRGIQSMSDSLNGMDGSVNGMNRSVNGMNSSRNGMDRVGIQSMSASLNGMQHMNNGPINSNMVARQQQHQQQRGIQSMSASLNGMQQASMSHSMNGMEGGYAGPHHPMNRSMNGMQNMQNVYDGGDYRQHHGMGQMSVSQNGMQQMKGQVVGGYPPQQQQGGHPLRGMSESLNSAPNGPYGGGHRRTVSGDHGKQMNSHMMNRSNHMVNAMSVSMNGMMNRSNNGSMLNNSNVPSAPLLNQVSNLANLPNRGSHGPSNSTDGRGPETSELSLKLMEAMKRTASSRKMIRELNISAMLRNDLKSRGTPKSKSVVKAKRNYTKTKFDTAASRDLRKTQIEQEVAS